MVFGLFTKHHFLLNKRKMKNFIERFKKIIRFLATIFASREFAFIYCLVGTTTQIAHTYFLTESISSFSGGFKIFQATLISFFISSSLLYFVAIHSDSVDEKEFKRNKLAINIFMIIEIAINFYYYARHLIIDSKELQVFDFIFAIIVSCLIPVTIKLYANTIRAKEWIEEMSDNSEISETTNLDEIKTEIDTLINNVVNEKLEGLTENFDIDSIKEAINIEVEKILSTVDSKINKIFEKHKDLFLQQIENKINFLLKDKISG